MKLYEITIKPTSGFGTPLKGDTLFGHLCWQAAYDSTILEGGLDKWVACYEERPFLICSTAWPKLYDDKSKMTYAVKRPDLPQSFLFRSSTEEKKIRMQERKENQKKKWLILNESLSLNLDKAIYKTDHDLLEKVELSDGTRRTMRGKEQRRVCTDFEQQHNTINRMTMTTGEGSFAPFAEMASYYYPETELAVFVLFDEEATDIDRVCTAFERIGQFGFGKDASTGWGRFEMVDDNELELPNTESANACYALSPVVPEKDIFSEHYFTPFVRFGRHGDILARSRNPFKNPILMADEGAVFIANNQEVFQKPYIGKAILNCSKSMVKTVHQGYAIYLPCKLEI